MLHRKVSESSNTFDAFSHATTNTLNASLPLRYSAEGVSPVVGIMGIETPFRKSWTKYSIPSVLARSRIVCTAFSKSFSAPTHIGEPAGSFRNIPYRSTFCDILPSPGNKERAHGAVSPEDR